jgi:predicted PurR-regulated permease PerM
MLGIDFKAARYTWTAVFVVLFLFVVYMVRSTLFIFILALLFAYLLSPLVDLLDRSLPGRRTRTPALALAYVLFMGIVVLAAIQIGSTVVEQANGLAKRFPELIAKWQQPSPMASETVNSLKDQLIEKVRQELAQRFNDLVSALPRAGLKFLTMASDLIFVVIIPILAFFFLKDAPLIRQHILDLVEEGPRRVLLDDVLADIHLLLAHYMRALVILSLVTFVAYSLFFWAMGVPYSLLLGAVGSMLEFIPMIGPLSAGIAIVLITAATGGHVVAIIVFLLVYRLIQDYVIQPHLMGQGVEIHPLLVLFGVFAGGEIAGIAGTFLSVPVLALGRILYLRFRKKRISVHMTQDVLST